MHENSIVCLDFGNTGVKIGLHSVAEAAAFVECDVSAVHKTKRVEAVCFLCSKLAELRTVKGDDASRRNAEHMDCQMDMAVDEVVKVKRGADIDPKRFKRGTHAEPKVATKDPSARDHLGYLMDSEEAKVLQEVEVDFDGWFPSPSQSRC